MKRIRSLRGEIIAEDFRNTHEAIAIAQIVPTGRKTNMSLGRSQGASSLCASPPALAARSQGTMFLGHQKREFSTLGNAVFRTLFHFYCARAHDPLGRQNSLPAFDHRAAANVEIAALLSKSPRNLESKNCALSTNTGKGAPPGKTRRRKDDLTHFFPQRRGFCRGAQGPVRNPHTSGRYACPRKSRIPMEAECVLARSPQTAGRDLVPSEITGRGFLCFPFVPAP